MATNGYFSGRTITELPTDYKFIGRKELYSSVKENELNQANIAMILKDVLPVHFENYAEIDYLIGYYRGLQEILSKDKKVRPEINNKVLENNAYHIVEFKKGYVYGDPIQYVQRGDTAKDEIVILNKFMAENDKASKDKELAEDMYIGGTAYRFITSEEDKLKPFGIYNINPKSAFVVYSTQIEHKPLLGGFLTSKYDYGTKLITYIITVYTKRNIYTFSCTEQDIKVLDADLIKYIPDTPKNETNWFGSIPIIEYPLNRNRLGVIELVKPSIDALNKIASADIDGLEQFVQSLMVFVNADVDATQLAEMVSMGAVKISSPQGTQGIQADIKLLINQLQHSETKVLYDRIYNNMLTIAGVPKMTDKASSGDTGQARLVGEGWTMADERAKQDELSFKLAEKQALKLIIQICKGKSDSGIKSLETSDIEIKFTRNKSDNLLVKTQGLINMMNAQIAPIIALQTSGLFSDPNEVFEQSQSYCDGDMWKMPDATNTDIAKVESPKTDVIPAK